VKVEIRNGIVTGCLQLKYSDVASEISLICCDFQEPVDFAYAVFRQNFTLSCSRFRKGLDLSNSLFEHRARLNRVRRRQGDI